MTWKSFLEYWIKNEVPGFSHGKSIPLVCHLGWGVEDARIKHLRPEKNRLSQDFRSTIKSPLKDIFTILFHLILP